MNALSIAMLVCKLQQVAKIVETLNLRNGVTEGGGGKRSNSISGGY